MSYYWERSGFVDYNNTSGDFLIVSDTWTDVTNDGLGAFSNSLYMPPGVTNLLDVSGGLTFSELNIGDAIFIRNDISITPAVNGAAVSFRYKLGSGAGEYYLPRYWGTLNYGAGFLTRFVEEDYIYMGDENTRGNIATLQINCTEDAVVNNAGCAIQIMRQGK